MSAVLKIFDGLCPNEKSEPDHITLDNFDLDRFSEDFVISRDIHGRIISLYKDDIWDFSHYNVHTSRVSKINFEARFKTIKSKHEAKKLMLIILLFSSGRNNSSISFNTITSYMGDFIDPFVNYANLLGTNPREIVANPLVLERYIKERCNTHGKIKTLSSFLILLLRTSNDLTGFNFKEDKKLFEKIRIIDNKFRSQEKQTLVIPSRILNNATKARWLHVNKATEYLINLTDFFKDYLDDKYFGTSLSRKIKTKDQNIYFWDRAVQKYELEKLFDQYNIYDRRTFQKYIYSLKNTCRHLIHTYSGMREAEVLSLKTNCYTEENTISILVGTTSKLEGKETIAKWITSSEIKKVINLLNAFNKFTAESYDLDFDILPIFIPNMPTTKQLKLFKKNIFSIKPQKIELDLNEDDILINANDLKELEEIHFNQNIKKLNIDEKWNFSTHQYRRSLAIYSIQSGLVSLGALQIQLKHLFREMTLYYGNGASYARKLFDIPQSHIANDIDKLKPELDTLAYIKNVIFSDEKLFGVHGHFVENHNKQNNQEFNTYFLENRDKTLKQFKNGEIAYKETALGGCISTEACDSRLTRSITACFDCHGGILKKSKVDNVIQKQREFISFLDPSSIEYRTEIEDLNKLEELKSKLIKEQ